MSRVRRFPNAFIGHTRDAQASGTAATTEVKPTTTATGEAAATFSAGTNGQVTSSRGAIANPGSTLTGAERARLGRQLDSIPTSDPVVAGIVGEARGALGTDAADLPAHLNVLTGHGANSVEGTLIRQRTGRNTARYILRPRDPALAPFELSPEACKPLEGATRVQASVVDGKLVLKDLDPAIPERFVSKVINQEGVRGVMSGDTFLAFDKARGNPAVGTVVQVDRAGDQVHLHDRLAKAGSPEAELYDIALDKGLDPTFSKEIRDEVDFLVQNPGLGDKGLKDLTDLAFVTIDNDDSKDLDQAMHIEKRPDGGYDVYYALADASHYIKPGTALFDEGVKRATTIYFPGFSIPMLPRELSEDVVSLNPPKDGLSAAQEKAIKSGKGVQELLADGFTEPELCDMGVRRSMVFKISLDKDAKNPTTEVFQATIRSRAKLAYNGVQAFHDGKPYPRHNDLKGKPFEDTLHLLEEVGDKRIVDAEDRGVVHYSRTNVKVSVADNKHGFVLLDESRNQVEKWNEQISLLCNMEGAKLLQKAGSQNLGNLQPIFRVHDAPPEGRLIKMQKAIDALVDSKGLPDSYRWDRGEQSLADYIRDLPRDTPAEMRLFHGIQRQAIMTNVASDYQEKASEHHGVGAEAYARFSSPMREMVGIFTHKELLEATGDGKHVANPQDTQLQDEIIDAAMTAKRQQRQVNKDANRLAIDDLFGAELQVPADEREARAGTIMGFERGKMYVRLDDPPIEVKVYLAELRAATGEQQDVDDSGAFVSDAKGDKLHLGDEIKIQCIGYDGERERFILRPLVED